MSLNRKGPWEFDEMNTYITLNRELLEKGLLIILGFLIDKIASSTNLIN